MKLTKSKLKEIIREELNNLNEVDLDKTMIPADVKRFMNRFIDKLKGRNLNRMKQVSILYKVIKALGLSPQELMRYTQKVKRGL